jgi:hypothetical protein
MHACVILHNLLSQLRDAWDELNEDLISSDQPTGFETTMDRVEDFCNKIQEKCIEFHYNEGTLPICLWAFFLFVV